ncbi:MAG: enoyl-CoA hydratase/isomerase family protein [Gammaproteobacteria bacterium]|nr:enoyl-CoA hydratase/isomerase family protein [Gammaproteobacteria bacterium]
MSYETLLFDLSDGVATITLHRPEAANTLNVQMSKDLYDAATRCDDDPGIRAVILTGAGKLFSGGGDIGAFAIAGDDLARVIRDITANLHTAVSRLTHMDAPLVCAVNGACAGGALGLGVCGDIVLAAQSARFTPGYTAIGMSADGGSTHLLPRLIGLRRTQELFFTNRRLSAEEALAWGLVTEVVADDELMSRARTLAESFAGGATRAYGEVKRLLAQTFGNGMETQLELETRSMAAMARSHDGVEGISAFTARRRPQFRGD